MARTPSRAGRRLVLTRSDASSPTKRGPTCEVQVDSETAKRGLTMTVTISKTSGETNNQRSHADYAGVVNGKPFRVQIDPCAAPYWYDSDLSFEDETEVLDAIDGV